MQRLADRYELDDALGHGRSTVYRAVDDRLKRHVAIKRVQILAGHEGAEQVRTRALREAQAAARLNNPHVVAVYDVVEESGAIWLVMELVDGPSLAQVVADEGPMPHQRAAAVGLGVLTALEAAHRVGVVHRDVKPANVLVCPGDRAKLTDFGVATIRDESRVTATGLIVGSPSYMAPEQATGGDITSATDMWALGALLYFAVEGEPPFRSGTALATASAVVHGEPRVQERPGPLNSVLARLFAKDPHARPGASEVRATLSRVARARRDRARVAAPTAAALPATAVASDAAAAAPPASDVTAAVAPPASDAAAAAPPASDVRAAVASPASSSSSASSSAVPAPSDATAVHAPGVPPAPELSRPPRRSRRKVLAAVAGGVVVLAVAAATLRDPAGESANDAPVPATAPAARGEAERTTTSATDGDTSTATTGATTTTREPPGLPEGWTPVEDPRGAYTIGLPSGWRVEPTSSPNRIDLVDTSTGSLLRVEWTDTPGSDVAGTWRDLAQSFSSRNANYDEVGITRVRYRDYDAALWEFRHGSGETLHTGNLGFVTGGRGYALMFRTPESLWSDSQPLFEQFKQAFQPLG